MRDKPTPSYLLDTHIALWWFEGEPHRMSSSAMESLEQSRRHGEVGISVISVWEIALLLSKGRVRLSQPIESWCASVYRWKGIRKYEITDEIAIGSTQLPEPVHGYPADRFLIATARANNLTIVTCDAEIIAYAGLGFVTVLDARP